MPNTVWLTWKMFYMNLVESEELLNYRKVTSTNLKRTLHLITLLTAISLQRSTLAFSFTKTFFPKNSLAPNMAHWVDTVNNSQMANDPSSENLITDTYEKTVTNVNGEEIFP